MRNHKFRLVTTFFFLLILNTSISRSLVQGVKLGSIYNMLNLVTTNYKINLHTYFYN